MAEDRKTHVYLPELDNQSINGEATKGRLTLETGKSYKGGIESSFKVCHVGKNFTSHAFGLGSGLGDFSGKILRVVGIATQKKIDAQHAQVFTPEVIADITAKALAYYAAKAAKKA